MMLVQRTRCSQRTWQQQRQLARPGAAVRPPRTSSFGSVASPAPLASTVVRALSDQSEREIEDMKQQAAGSDIWDSDVFATIFKVIVVAGIASVTYLLANAAEPVIRSTINAFPHT